jgi:hypothetical protein
MSCTAKRPELAELTNRKPPHSATVTNELLVKFNEQTAQDDIDKAILVCKGKTIKHLKGINVYHLQIESDASTGINCFKKSQFVKYAEPNRVVKIYK